MNIFKKAVATLTAITSMATMAMGAVAVSATDKIDMSSSVVSLAEQKAFINSYKADNEKAAAKLYLSAGISLNEAKKLMDSTSKAEK